MLWAVRYEYEQLLSWLGESSAGWGNHLSRLLDRLLLAQVHPSPWKIASNSQFQHMSP